MPVVGGIDIHRAQLTFDYVDLDSGEVVRGRIAPADREHLRRWLQRFAGRDQVAFALEGCTGWRYVAEELTRAGIAAHVAEPAETAARCGPKRRAKTDLLTELPGRAGGRGVRGRSGLARFPRRDQRRGSAAAGAVRAGGAAVRVA